MTPNNQTIQFLRRRIPTFECEPGCQDCRGSVTASNEKMARLPEKSDTKHAATLAALNCSHLGEMAATGLRGTPDHLPLVRHHATTRLPEWQTSCNDDRPEYRATDRPLFRRNTPLAGLMRMPGISQWQPGSRSFIGMARRWCSIFAASLVQIRMPLANPRAINSRSAPPRPRAGRATDHMVRFLAEEFGVVKSDIEVVFGRMNVNKQLRIK